MDIAELFRRNLRRIREAAELSQSDLARRLHRRASWICDLERGRDGRAPSIETIGRLAWALGVDADALLRRPEKKSKIPTKHS